VKSAKRLLQRSALFGLTLALVLGVGLPLRQTPVRAQAAGVASASPAQAADAEKKPPEQDETDTYRKSPRVVEWGAKLGLNPDQSSLAFTLFNFLLLAAAFVWVAAKMLPKFFRDRSAGIQKHLVDARTATEEARARLSGVEARLAKLDDEIAAMRAHAEQDSAREEQRIKASVEDEKRKILTEAEHEITVATMHAQKLLQQHAAELAIEQAARKLVVSAETDRLLVQGFAQRLSGDESKKGQN
jgi:F-type H+-transporting ATPase subunit b